MSPRRKRPPHPSETKDQQISELQEQLSQALEIIRKQQKQIERLEQRVQQQQEEFEYLKRIGKSQATPFARRHWVVRPKRPGRKAGKGRFAHRELPQVVKISETKEAKLHGCPACGSRLEAICKQEQFVTDIPVVEVKTTCFVTYSGYCTVCHKPIPFSPVFWLPVTNMPFQSLTTWSNFSSSALRHLLSLHAKQVQSKPRTYFQSIRARTASAACRSDNPSENCMTVTRAKRPGDSAD